MEFRSTVKETLKDLLVPDAMTVAEVVLGVTIIAGALAVDSCYNQRDQDGYQNNSAYSQGATRASP